MDNKLIPSFDSKFIPAAILAIGIASAGFFAGHGLVKSRLGFRTVTVKGLAERSVKADLGFWPIKFVATGPSLADARASLNASNVAVQNYLKAQGFAAADISVQNIQVQDKWADSYGQQVSEGVRYVLTENVMVRSTDVNKISTASSGIAALIDQGVIFSSDSYSAGPTFLFTKLNDLKPVLLTEATRRAREAAQQFAQQSGARVGGIQNANQGVIEVNPAVEIPNESGEKQIDKTVRVVTTITYFIKG
ncbi:MAG: SIMPL domain-containing protein [Pseudomonadota bacterium]